MTRKTLAAGVSCRKSSQGYGKGVRKRCVAVAESRSSDLSRHEDDLLDLRKGRVLSKPLALRRVLAAQRVLDVGVCDGEQLLCVAHQYVGPGSLCMAG